MLTGRRICLFLFVFIFSLFISLLFVAVSKADAVSERDMLNPTILTNEGWKYLRQGSSQNFNKAEEYFRNSEKYFQKAEEYFQKALSIDKDYADAYAGLGKLAMERDRLPYNDYKKDQCKKALEFFDKAISLDNKNYRGHYNKGEALLCLEDYEGTAKESGLIEGCPSHYLKSKAHEGMFENRKDASDRRMAIIEATDYLECAQNNNSSGQIALGMNTLRKILRTTKDFDSTEKYFKRNIELKPHLMWSYHNYYEVILLRTAEGYLKDTDILEVERILKEGKSNTNFDIGAMWEFHSRRGEVFFQRKEYDKALVEYTECLAGNPNLSHLKERMSFLCSQFTNNRCIKSWQRIIQAYLDRGDCSNAAKEFKVQYGNNPASFEQMKDAVLQCKEKKL